jgi:ribosome-binding protein aMBF1 (putative translation factor)
MDTRSLEPVDIPKVVQEGSDDERQILRELGSKVRRFRVEKGLSQEELGEKSRLHRTYIGSIERSERNVSLINIQRIAKALGVPVCMLF